MDNVLDFVGHKVSKSLKDKINALSEVELKLCRKLEIPPEKYLEQLELGNGLHESIRQSSTVPPNTRFNVAIVSKKNSTDYLGVFITGTETNSDSVYFKHDTVPDLIETLKYAVTQMDNIRGE